MTKNILRIITLTVLTASVLCTPAWAQLSGAIEGVVKDASGGVIPGARVAIYNTVTGFQRDTTTDTMGVFRFTNIPFNPYHLTVNANGFSAYDQDVDVRSLVTVSVAVDLKVAGATSEVQVTERPAELVEVDPIAHTDVDRALFDKMPLESVSSSISSLVTFTTPGVALDSNGFMHGLGEHQENQFSVDGQPISDQQSKAFSNQLPVAAVQSLEAVNGIPPAEYGDKTTLIVAVTTRSGLGSKPTGSVSASYGSFGTGNVGFDLAAGQPHLGNFISANGVQSGRFLDPPEFTVLHAKGNNQNIFDRMDFQPNTHDSLHINANYARSWFQQPNQFDQDAAGQDQRALINTVNIAPQWAHTFSASSLLTINGFVRADRYHYYPSADAFADTPATLAQNRHLTNAGGRLDFSYVRGAHNIKAGAQYQHWFLKEQFNLGFTDPTFNPICFTDSNLTSPVVDRPTIVDPSQCTKAGFFPNTLDNGFQPGFVPYDLTRGGTLLKFNDHTDIKETALYLQDGINVKNWSFNLGLRGDFYHGLSSQSAAEPRAAIAYNIKGTNTVLRAGYGRSIVTPYNENLIVSSSTGLGGLGGTGGGAIPPKPGTRDLFNAGFEQAFGRYIVATLDYYWKYTQPDYDFGVLFSTPLTFPIQWAKSRIDGLAARISVPNINGFTLVTVMGTSRDRFFPPGVGGLVFNQAPPPGVFRIDHDQAFQQTTHLQYQWKRTGPWFAFNWRYDSGLVAGAVPFATDSTRPIDLTVLTPDQQQQGGLACGSVVATLANPLTRCAPTQYRSTRINIPAPGAEDDDHNPPRVNGRNLFDMGAGIDSLFRREQRGRVSLRFTVINVANNVALYNFLSTFSGTHFVTPRSYTGELGFHF
jgi:hypothetical protein